MRGTPVVASRVGALPELIRHGETGLLVAPADPNELCEALGSLLSHEGIRLRLADNARAWASQHAGLEGMIDGLLELYGEILTEPKT
jgi:glycosyltransferase involved in cell wall biosynthesis